MITCFDNNMIKNNNDNIEVYPLASFPTNIIAFHFPCLENEVFDTNCACHTLCKDKLCNNAIELCKNYKEQGCKYVLLRGSDNRRIATLKRSVTIEERKRYSYDTNLYPKDEQEIINLIKKKKLLLNNNVKGSNLKNIMEIGGSSMKSILNDLIKNDMKNNKYCNMNKSNSSFYHNNIDEFLNKGIALVGLNYRTPLTLLNSIRSWNNSGLLSLIEDKIMILNDPYPNEILLSLNYGFKVIQPNDIKGSKMNKPNVFTIGAAFYYSLTLTNSEYILFLENDFSIDTSLSIEEISKQLFVAAAMLDNGAEIVRLMSRKGQGCGTFKGCHHHGINLKANKPIDRTRNWYSFYCPRNDNEALVSDCFNDPRFRCFTSWDSNWSLNAVMIKRKTILEKKYDTHSKQKEKITIADIALESSSEQDKFENSMIHKYIWMRWKVPICISYDGLFLHQEIETNA